MFCPDRGLTARQGSAGKTLASEIPRLVIGWPGMQPVGNSERANETFPICRAASTLPVAS